MGLGAVLCLWFPAVLTTPELREIYGMTLIRALIKLGLLAAFLLGVASLLLYVLGFAPGPTYAYLVFVSFQTIFIHANLRLALGPLRWVIASPEYHHWHHSAQHEAVDKNFAVHLPVIDRLFGTFHLPPRWPERYGVAGGAVPDGYLAQLTYPFRPRPSRATRPA